MAQVELINVTKRYGDFLAVSAQNLFVDDGEFLVLLGPSGCGKTTTMRMIAGLEDITSGEIIVDGERVNEKPPGARDIAMVFQNYGLYPHMTVAENIAYPLKIRGISKEERARKVEEVARKVELDRYLTRRPSALSGGQRQRVALARAIIRRPKLFLMDEPLSNLDAKLRVTMRAELKHLHHELKITTIYVTHDQMEAMTLADRIAVLNHGEIIQLDTPEKIYSEPADLFVAGFIGSPAMNLIPGHIADGVFHAPGVKIQVGHHVTMADIVLGVRPEDLIIVNSDTAHIVAPLYALELTGESTLATIRAGETMICAKSAPEFRAEMNTPIGMAIRTDRIHLFDAKSAKRITL